MFTFLSPIHPELKFVLAFTVIGCGAAVLIVAPAVFAKAWAQIRANELRNELIRDLLDQGKTPEEIEQILNLAEGAPRSSESAAGWWGKR